MSTNEPTALAAGAQVPSSYECQELSCSFNIHSAGTLSSDEDYDAQDYVEQEIEDHVARHREEKAAATGRVEGVALHFEAMQGGSVRTEFHLTDRERWLIGQAVDASMARLADHSAAFRQSARRVGFIEPVEEIPVFEERDSDARIFKGDGQRSDSESVLDSETTGHLNVLAEQRKRVARIEAPNNALGINNGSVDVLTDVHKTSPSVGAPDGAGCDIPDPTGGDEAGTSGHVPGVPGNQTTKKKPPAGATAEGSETPNA